MTRATRTSYQGPPLTGSGIIWTNSVPKAPLSEEVFSEWYESHHIPAIRNAKPGPAGCVAAWRFKSRDVARTRRYLALYFLPDLSFLQSPEFGRVRMHHELLPQGGPAQKFADFDTRFYRRVQVFESREPVEGIGKVVKCTAIQPAQGMEEEFDKWYTEEHLEQVSQMSGWRKTTRYELIFKVQSADDPNWDEAPKYLAIHEFEEGTEVKRIPKASWTEWTKRIVESAVAIDECTFDYLWSMADAGTGL
ncbi:hypothetical protein BCR34DRAFT_482668 [Clohesyomyces aquaticus]|uniref:Uncharacterized protein n=1 Tax=Clohesyomyces aquaticus TaxID=1231657 RepID=A0A1Y1ZQC0_9PLEO|nr:hypothetical protein BCR34DRAFT_482668 [Clohesyomyces aquaticus]